MILLLRASFVAIVCSGCLFVRTVVPYVEMTEGPSGPTGVTEPTGPPAPTDDMMMMTDTCANDEMDGDETDVDCGGSCTTKCAHAQMCNVAADCALNLCNADKRCGCSDASADATSPVLFFTDLLSGPRSGGEDGNGVFVTLYGERFGATMGSVTVGGGAVSRIVSWEENAGPARELDRIVVQLGPLAQTGLIQITTAAGRISNGKPFTVRATGRVLFLDRAAATEGDGGVATPFKTLATAIAALSIGDTLYIKGGDFTEYSTEGAERHYFQLTRPFGGTETQPIAIVGYPSQPPRFGPDTATGFTCSGDPYTNWGIVLGSSSDNAGPWVSHVVIANMVVRNSEYGLWTTGVRHRLVGLDVVGTCGGADIADTQDHMALLGSRIRGGDYSSGTTLSVGPFFGQVQDELDIGYNELGAALTGAFQSLRLHADNLSSHLEHVRLHDNRIGSAFKIGLLSNGGGFIGSVRLENNVFFATDLGISLENALDAISLAHNTFLGFSGYVVDVGGSGQNVGFSFNALSSGASPISGTPPSTFSFFRNHWTNLTMPPTEDVEGTTGLAFTNPANDGHLKPNTPPIDHAQTLPDLCSDFDGLPRPLGAAPDVGAYEAVP